MGKYSTSSRRPPAPKRDSIPPLVRGIGCLMFVLVPIFAYGLSIFAVNYVVNNGWPIPREWLGAPRFNVPPGLPLITDFMTILHSQNNLIANLVFTLGISVVLFGIMSIIYGYMYSMTGPSQYGPQDVPPPRVKTRKYKR